MSIQLQLINPRTPNACAETWSRDADMLTHSESSDIFVHFEGCFCNKFFYDYFLVLFYYSINVHCCSKRATGWIKITRHSVCKGYPPMIANYLCWMSSFQMNESRMLKTCERKPMSFRI